MSASILVSNYNSWEAIQLCLESINKHTNYPFDITVYDDCSTNKVDLEYLRRQRNIGWLTLIEGKKRVGHGEALNTLLDSCESDFACILDNDIQILKTSWLEDFVSLFKNETDILACGIEHNLNIGRPAITSWFQTWFMMLNMKPYRNVAINWDKKIIDGTYYPVGADLWLKLVVHNLDERRRVISPLPERFNSYFHHFAHVSCTATFDKTDTKKFIKVREVKMGTIREALKKIRKNG